MADDQPTDLKDEVQDFAPFDATKKNVVLQDPAEDTIDKLVEKTDALSVSDGLESNFDGLKKKKKQVETNILDEESTEAVDGVDDHGEQDEDGEGLVPQQHYPWDGTDWNYNYDEEIGIGLS